MTVRGHRCSLAIERHGGVPADVRDTELGIVRRYWIRTRARRSM
ncbi:hypothetical protein J2853_001998 [Streptosporangium lutulentum]|uniref:Uncharacterized protein n=1 Tax=Streptosporangium lutulentum TaxID=1461250 RepID=A0ABT9Q7T5_9ACTN|nr:hypothetical protein [Streptosporangium lutulentum]MDP9842787.1 hypothetical protein [Streptosporangium lutulentum]